MRFQKLIAGGRLLYLGIITNPWHQTCKKRKKKISFSFFFLYSGSIRGFCNKIFGELRHCGDKPVKDRRVSFITLASAPKQLECVLKGDRLFLWMKNRPTAKEWCLHSSLSPSLSWEGCWRRAIMTRGEISVVSVRYICFQPSLSQNKRRWWTAGARTIRISLLTMTRPREVRT